MTSIYFVRHTKPNHAHEDDRTRPLTEEGVNGNNLEMFKKRWNDFNYHEEGGESLQMVQDRNIEALFELLDKHKDENIIVGTHGTALSTILNYFDNDFLCEEFLGIIDYMPYIIRLDFECRECVAKEEILVVEKNINRKLK